MIEYTENHEGIHRAAQVVTGAGLLLVSIRS